MTWPNPKLYRAQVKSRRKAIWIAIASVVGVIVLLLLIKGSQIMTMISAGKRWCHRRKP